MGQRHVSFSAALSRYVDFYQRPDAYGHRYRPLRGYSIPVSGEDILDGMRYYCGQHMAGGTSAGHASCSTNEPAFLRGLPNIHLPRRMGRVSGNAGRVWIRRIESPIVSIREAGILLGRGPKLGTSSDCLT